MDELERLRQRIQELESSEIALKRAKKALRESEERYSSLFESSQTPILLIDPENARIEDANPCACSYYGYDRDRLRTMKLTELTTMPETSIVEDLQKAKTGKQEHFYFRHCLANGEVRDVGICWTPFTLKGRQFLHSLVHDVTEVKQIQERLHESEMRCKAFFHEAPISIIGFDRDWVIQYVNEYHLKTFARNKVGPEFFVGKRLTEFPHVVKSGYMSELERVLRGETIEARGLYVEEFTGGQAGYINLKGVPLFKKGEISGGLLMIEDVTDLKRMEEVLAEEAGTHDIRLVGKSPLFLECLEKLHRASRFGSPVLLSGETGTGKEIAAVFVHQHSARKDKPFITIDCTVLTESLFETEVFGHEKGAFTGSVASQKGLIELANGGTLFLDEISEIPLPMQAKLLRVLERGEFRRVGGKETLTVDVRLICATNRRLLDQVEKGLFRGDLYYRIAVFTIHIPALRDRLSDIPYLAEDFLRQMSEGGGVKCRLTQDALRCLSNYSYPGNVRELRNVLNLAASYTSSSGIISANEIKKYFETQDIKPELTCDVKGSAPFFPNGKTPLAEIEKSYIVNLLRQFDGNKQEAAKSMGISERTLYRKMKRCGLR